MSREAPGHRVVGLPTQFKPPGRLRVAGWALVFYRLVAANAIPNADESYQRLSEILDKARWKGERRGVVLYAGEQQKRLLRERASRARSSPPAR